MRIDDFAELVAKHEGLKKQVNIAQIKEVIRVINDISLGAFYKEIRKNY